jgi:hypothetical protein
MSTFGNDRPGLFIIMQDASGSMAEKKHDSLDAVVSSFRKLIDRSHKGARYLRNYKIMLIRYYSSMNYMGPDWPEEFAKHGKHEEWEDWAPPPSSNTNMIKAYNFALIKAKEHREEYFQACIVIMNITDGKHNEFLGETSPIPWKNKKEEGTFEDIISKLENLNVGDPNSNSADGLCILGYLWYMTQNDSKRKGLNSFPTDKSELPSGGRELPISKLPREFVNNLKIKKPYLYSSHDLTDELPYFFMNPSEWAKVDDFIQIGTTTHSTSNIMEDTGLENEFF